MSAGLLEFVASGQAALAAIGVLALELAALLWRGERPRAPLIWNALSGAALMLALYCALSGRGPAAVALFMGLGFVAHLGDLVTRSRRRG